MMSSSNAVAIPKGSRNFTRGGPLDPAFLISFLLYMIADAGRRGYRHLLDGYWDEARAFGLSTPTADPVSAPAISKARGKLPPQLIRSLVHQVADSFDSQFGSENRWLGRRVFAVDGSKINTQRSCELAHAFGTPAGGHCPQILVSTLFDLFAKVPHDVVIAPGASCERRELVRLLDRAVPGDVVVLDRGYPSFELLWILADRKIDFVMRVPTKNTFSAVMGFVYREEKDSNIEISPPSDSPLKERGSFCVRAIRSSVTPSGDPIVILTSLSQSVATTEQTGDLYRRRWEIEEFYKLTKGDYIGQGQFHAKSARGVEQEVVAVTLFVAIARLLMASAAVKHELPYDSLSPKSGMLGLAAYMLRIVLCSTPERMVEVIEALLSRIVRTRDDKRPGRRCPRRSFRPSPRWGPSGRRAG